MDIRQLVHDNACINFAKKICMKTLKLRIRDKHINQLNRLSGSVNFVWNYVNALSYEHLKRTGKFFSAYDLNE